MKTIDITGLCPAPVWRSDPDAHTLPLFRKWKVRGGVIIDEREWQNVLENCQYFDAAVYSANGEAAKNCRRLITAKVWGLFPASCKVKRASNVHTKLYILRTVDCGWGSDNEVWVGSRNLVLADSYHNVMVKITDAHQVESLELYFKRLWNLAMWTARPPISSSEAGRVQ